MRIAFAAFAIALLCAGVTAGFAGRATPPPSERASVAAVPSPPRAQAPIPSIDLGPVSDPDVPSTSCCISSAGGAFANRSSVSPAASVHAALRGLATHQAPDGGFRRGDFARGCAGKTDSPGSAQTDDGQDVATTALGVLAFLGAGYTNRSDDAHGFGRAVASGIRWLKNVQDAEGSFARKESADRLHDHAIATLALLEAYGMTGSAVFANPAQKGLRFLLQARATSGAWPRADGAGDPATTAWAALAWGTARRIDAARALVGKPPDFDISARVADDALRWALGRAGRSGPDSRDTLFVALLGAVAGSALDSDGIARALEDEAGRSASNPEWRHFAALAAHAAGGAARRASDAHLTGPWIAAQRTDGDPCSGAGSWTPLGVDETDLGALGLTALAARTLELRGSLEHPAQPLERRPEPTLGDIDVAPEAEDESVR